MRSADAVGAVIDFQCEAGDAQRGASADTGRMDAGGMITSIASRAVRSTLSAT